MANDHIADVGKKVRMIDANSIKYREKDEYCGNGNCRPMLFVTKEDIAEMPTVDAVEVVRCKDCKHFVQGEPYDPCECMKWMVKWGVAYTTPDGYCHKGERRPNDG